MDTTQLEPEPQTATTSAPRQPDPSHSATGENSDSNIDESGKGPLGLTTLFDPAEPAIADLIFVHGIGGGSRSTWAKSNDASLYWPEEWLPKDDAFKDVRIHSFGYRTYWGAEIPPSVHDCARTLLMSILNCPSIPRQTTTPLVLVGHSTGGTVIKCALIQAEQWEKFVPIAQSMRAMFFLATPHKGPYARQVWTDITRLPGHPLSGIKMPHFPDIQHRFRLSCSDIDLYSFYETLPTSFKLTEKIIVDRHTAVLGFESEVVRALDADHHGVCKYSDTSDQNYRAVRDALARPFERFRAKAALSRRRLVYGRRLAYGRHDDHEQFNTLSTLLGVEDSYEDSLVLYESMRAPGSCEWLMNKDAFRLWQDSPQTQIYWMSGKPGAGKTVLSGKVIAHLRALDHNCAFFFFKSLDESKSTISSFLLSMAMQMSFLNPEAFRIVLDIFEEDSQLREADHHTIWKKLFLEGILRPQFLRPQYWVVDALDECESNYELASMLLKAVGTGQIRIFLTSRKPFEFYRHVGHSDARVISEEILEDDTNSDIALYLEENMYHLHAVQEDSRQYFVRKILNSSAGTFVFATFVVEKLRECHTFAEIRSSLHSVQSMMGEALSDMRHRGTRKSDNAEDPGHLNVQNDTRPFIGKLFENAVESAVDTVQSKPHDAESTFAILGKQDGSMADDWESSVGSTWINKSTMDEISRPGNEVPSVDSGYVSWTYQSSTGSQKGSSNANQPTLREGYALENVKEAEEEDTLSQKSVESFGEGISSLAESLIDADTRAVAQNLILEILENDKILNPLLRESLERFERHRVIKNLAGFMEGYCVLLDNAQPTQNQKRTIRFFRRRRSQFASILCNNLHPSTLDLNKRIDDEKSKALVAERKSRLARWVTDNSDDVSPTTSIDDNESDIRSDESWDSSEGLPPVLEDIRVFLINGEPLELFRQNFARFVAGESMKDWNSMIRSKRQLRRGQDVDRSQDPTISGSSPSGTDLASSVEAKTDNILEIENNGGFKVSWGCRCGRRFAARIAGSDRRVAEEFFQRMDWKVERDGPMVTHCFNLKWLENLLWVLAPNLLPRFSFELPRIRTESEDVEAGRDSNLPQSTSNPTNRGQSGAQTQMRRHSTVNNANIKRDLVYVCLFSRKNNCWRLKHAKIYRSHNTDLSGTQGGEGRKNNRDMDKALFLALRERLVGAFKGTGWFSPLVITGLEFWEFQLFYTAKLVKRVTKDKLPHESQTAEPDISPTLQLEWEYNPLTGEKLSAYKEILQGEFLLHLLKYPEDAHPDSPIWTGLPRKIRTKLINRQSTPKTGWGFSVDHEWNTLAFTVSMCPVIIAGFIVATYLAVMYKWPMSAAVTLALGPVTLIAFLNTMLKDIMKQKSLSK